MRHRPVNVKPDNSDIDTAIMDFLAAPHLRINKDILNIYGLDVALWIADISSRWNYFRKEKKLINDYFFVTQEEIRKTTKLNFNKQSNIIRLLTEKQIIDVKKQGIPAKNWYKLKISTLILDIKTIKNEQDLKVKSFEIQRTGSLRYKGLKENKNNCNKNNNIVSKDTYVSEKHNDIILSIINFWNNLPNTTTHSKTDTKIYKNIYLQIENLLCGLPLIRKKDKTPTEPFLDFVEGNNISRKIYLKEWDESDIKKVFQKINDGIEEDQSKKISMDQTFWNAFAKKRGGGFSLFLHITANMDFDLLHKDIVSKFIKTIGKRIEYKTKIQWGKQIDDFINKDNITEEEINEILDWYAIHKGEQYIPTIDTPFELQEKYTKLKQAIDRAKNPTYNQSSSPKQPLPKSNPTKESLNLFPHEAKNLDSWIKIYSDLTDLWINTDIWPHDYQPNRDKIYAALIELKGWVNNLIYGNNYGVIRRVTRTLQIICKEYIDWIERQGWLEEGIKEGSLFPDSEMFKNHFIPDLEGDIMDIPIRSRGWKNDSNLNIQTPVEIEGQKKQEAEQWQEREQENKIAAENEKENISWMHSCMKKYLSDLDKVNIDNLDISKWKRDLNKQEFEKFVIVIEKKHQENPTNRGNSYQFLFQNRAG